LEISAAALKRIADAVRNASGGCKVVRQEAVIDFGVGHGSQETFASAGDFGWPRILCAIVWKAGSRQDCLCNGEFLASESAADQDFAISYELLTGRFQGDQDVQE
jgi:hypothetical protein